jgi:hypothetical protein
LRSGGPGRRLVGELDAADMLLALDEFAAAFALTELLVALDGVGDNLSGGVDCAAGAGYAKHTRGAPVAIGVSLLRPGLDRGAGGVHNLAHAAAGRADNEACGKERHPHLHSASGKGLQCHYLLLFLFRSFTLPPGARWPPRARVPAGQPRRQHIRFRLRPSHLIDFALPFLFPPSLLNTLPRPDQSLALSGNVRSFPRYQNPSSLSSQAEL